MYFCLRKATCIYSKYHNDLPFFRKLKKRFVALISAISFDNNAVILLLRGY
jgi:hypothetical protein